MFVTYVNWLDAELVLTPAEYSYLCYLSQNPTPTNTYLKNEMFQTVYLRARERFGPYTFGNAERCLPPSSYQHLVWLLRTYQQYGYLTPENQQYWVTYWSTVYSWAVAEYQRHYYVPAYSSADDTAWRRVEYEKELKRLDRKVSKRLSRQKITWAEARELLQDYVGGGKVLDLGGTNSWYPGDLEFLYKLFDKAEEETKDLIRKWTTYDYPVKCRISGYPVLVPIKMEFSKIGIDCLRVFLRPSLVYMAEVVREGHYKYDKWFKEKWLGIWVDICTGEDVTVVWPVRLIRGLMEGSLQPDGCEITHVGEDLVVYNVEGYGEPVKMKRKLIECLRQLGGGGRGDPLERFVELGLLDPFILEAIQARTSARPLPSANPRDLKYLERVREVGEKFQTLSEWARYFGVKDRTSAYKIVRRLEKREFVKFEKHPDGKGIKVSLTYKGIQALR